MPELSDISLYISALEARIGGTATVLLAMAGAMFVSGIATGPLSGLTPLLLVMYAALGAEFPKELHGRLNAYLTLCWLLGGFVIQNIYGFVLNQFPATEAGYAAEGHRMSMGVNFGILIIALVWYFAFSAAIKRQRMP